MGVVASGSSEGVCCVEPLFTATPLLRKDTKAVAGRLNPLLCFLACTDTVLEIIPGAGCLGLLLLAGIK